jgi:hypothetical protein
LSDDHGQSEKSAADYEDAHAVYAPTSKIDNEPGGGEIFEE